MANQATDYFVGDELPASVWSSKYALRDFDDTVMEQNPDQMHWRMSNEIARVEAKKFKNPYSATQIHAWMKDFGAIIPQGSPMSGIGSKRYVSLSNCYVTDCPVDSYSGVMMVDEQMVQICKRRGGVGTDLSEIRPAEMPTTNSARKATGVVPFCERYSNTIREVGQEGRRGALMISLSVHHPEIVDFAKMKLDPNKVTGANVSVRLSDEFLKAVEAGTTYEQRWPVDSATPTISRMVDAREVWDEIIKCAHARAEPGLLFWDRIISESPADCYSDVGFKTRSTNPCSELPLSVLDSCRLLLVNLFYCVEYPFTNRAKFSFEKLAEYSAIAQRLMDDIVDLELECIDRIIGKVESDPEPEHIKVRELDLWKRIRKTCEDGRRTGTGITALGDSLAAVGIKYGSDESIEATAEIYKTLKLAAYRSSVEMAKELGAFPVWDHEKEKNNPFLLRIKGEDPQLWEDMKQYGRRNIALLTTAPAGSVSICAGPRPYFGTTSGIEPLFTDKPYTRRKKINHGDKTTKADFVDDRGDRWTEHTVFHAKLRMWMDITGETDYTKSPYHGCTANDIDWKQRVILQARANEHCDHAISSTLNLPNDVSVEKVAEIYETAWRAGCKGITVYRDGCRDGVLVTKPTPKAGIQKTTAPKRPADMPCDIHVVKVKGQSFLVLIGKLGGDPYEAFVCESGRTLEAISGNASGILRKVKKGRYDLLDKDGVSIQDNIGLCLTDEQSALTRMVSTSLRHGADIAFVAHQLEKSKGDITGFAKAVARVLKKYVKDGTKVSGSVCQKCGGSNIVFQEGCSRCVDCGDSKCG